MLKAGLLFLLVFGIEMVGDVAEDHEWDRRVQGYPLGRVKPDQKAGGQAGDKGKPRRERIEGGLELELVLRIPFFQSLLPELELAQGDRHPDEDHRRAGDGNQDQVDRVSRVDTGQEGEDPTQHAYQQGDGRNPSFVGFGKNNWNSPLIAQGPEHLVEA